MISRCIGRRLAEALRLTAACGALHVELVGQSTDRARLDAQVPRLRNSDDVHSGAGADVCVAVHGDRGSVCRCDESMAGRLDVALGVGEDDSLIFGANLGVIGTDNVAFPARFDGDAIECFDVREFVGGDTGAVAGLEEASTGGSDGSSADSGTRLTDDLHVDSVRDMPEVEPQVRVGVDDQSFGAAADVVGVFAEGVNDQCWTGGTCRVESCAAAVSFSDWGVHRVMLPLLVSFRVVLVAASPVTMREHRRSRAARADFQASEMCGQ